jgi:general stress protein 26
MDTNQDTPDTEQHFRELMQSFSTAMLVTNSEDGGMRARPMHVAGVDDDGTLWFATRFDSPKTDELMADQSVAVTMQGMASFVSVTGSADIVIDQPHKVRELWKETWRPWYPAGPEDPQLSLLRVRVQDAAFWDYRGMAGVRYVFDAIRHALKRERMNDGAGPDAHKRVSS